MAKRVIGSYPSETTTLQKIEQLLAEGYSKESITLVTNPKTEQSIRSQTDIEILTQTSESKDNESLGDKIKGIFSIDSDEDPKLNSAIPNEEILDNYKEAIEKGNSVILVEEDPSLNTIENTYPIDTDTVEDDAAGIYPTAPDLLTEDEPSDLARGEKQTHSTRTQHLDYDENDLDPGINTDGDLEIEEDFPPTETPDRTDFYE